MFDLLSFLVKTFVNCDIAFWCSDKGSQDHKIKKSNDWNRSYLFCRCCSQTSCDPILPFHRPFDWKHFPKVFRQKFCDQNRSLYRRHLDSNLKKKLISLNFHLKRDPSYYYVRFTVILYSSLWTNTLWHLQLILYLFRRDNDKKCNKTLIIVVSSVSMINAKFRS